MNNKGPCRALVVFICLKFVLPTVWGRLYLPLKPYASSRENGWMDILHSIFFFFFFRNSPAMTLKKLKQPPRGKIVASVGIARMFPSGPPLPVTCCQVVRARVQVQCAIISGFTQGARSRNMLPHLHRRRFRCHIHLGARCSRCRRISQVCCDSAGRRSAP